MAATSDILLRVSDLRQWEYCPRVVYYRYVLPVPFRESYKMQRARRVEEQEQERQLRRTTRRYGLHDVRKRFDVSLESQEIGLVGKLDLLLETEHDGWPVEVKDTSGGVRPNHVAQLAAYAVLIEHCLKKTCRGGFVYLTQERRAEAVELTGAVKQRVRDRIEEIRTTIVEQDLPEATEVRGRCRDCEYRNYCGDIF